MKRILTWVLLLLLATAACAAPVPVTPYTVMARVVSYEHYRSFGGAQRYSLDTPHGNDSTIVATIVFPESLAGREIAIPFEASVGRKELLVQKGTIFRFDHTMNLADIRNRTEGVRRRALPFPGHGILVLKPNGEVAEAYEGSLSGLK